MTVRPYVIIAALLCAVSVMSAPAEIQILGIEVILVIGASVVMRRGIRQFGPDAERAWWWLPVGPWLVLAGAVASEITSGLGLVDVVVESTALLEVLGFAIAAAGMWMLLRPSSSTRSRATNLDTAVLAVAMGVLSWSVLVPTYPHDDLAGAIERINDVGQSVLSTVFLLGAVMSVIVAWRRAGAAVGYLLAAGTALVVGDFVVPFVQRIVSLPAIEDACLLVALVCLAASASHPNMARITAPAWDADLQARVRLLALVLVLAAPPLVFAADLVTAGELDHGTAIAAWGLITAVVIRRLMVLHLEREHLVQQIRLQSQRDELTGLLNRRGLLDALDRVIPAADELDVDLALFYLDLDDFKPVNDEYGHDIGDLVLIHIAERMEAIEWPTDLVVARAGGDEFVVAAMLDARADVAHLAAQLDESVTTPMSVPGGLVSVGVSIGIDIRPPGGHDHRESLLRADQAMYSAKSRPDRMTARPSSLSS